MPPGNDSVHALKCDVVRNHLWMPAKRTWSSHSRNICFVGDPVLTLAPPKGRNIGGIFFQKNENIRFLPINLHESFADIKVYDASHCSIKTVRRENFQGLASLRWLWLGSNSISFIDEDVFTDLKQLQQLNLGATLALIESSLRNLTNVSFR